MRRISPNAGPLPAGSGASGHSRSSHCSATRGGGDGVNMRYVAWSGGALGVTIKEEGGLRPSLCENASFAKLPQRH